MSPEHGRAVDFRFSILGSGSSGNATYVETSKTRLLIDAGLSAREIERRLAAIGRSAETLDAVLVSHEHADHCRGLERLLDKRALTVVASPGTLRALAAGLPGDADRVELRPGRSVQLGDLELTPIPVPHDAAEPTGFRVTRGDSGIGQVTDLGTIDRTVEEGLRGLTALILESNYDLEMLHTGRYPWSLKRRVRGARGHLSNEATAGYLRDGPIESLRLLYLAHLSRHNNLPELAEAAAVAALGRRGVDGVTVELAPHDVPTPLAEVPGPVRTARMDASRQPGGTHRAQQIQLPFAGA